MVDSSVTTVLLEGLSPLTAYAVNVYSMSEETRSEPLKGTDVTCEQSSASIMFR